MPELPEVETIVRKLQRGEPCEEGQSAYPSPVGCGIIQAWADWPNSIRPSIKSVTRTLPGHRIQSLGRRGKYLVFTLAPPSGESLRFLIIHLKMSGRIELLKTGTRRHKHVHFTCSLDTGYTLHFNDARKFGRVYCVNELQDVIGHLGPEPLEPAFTLRKFRLLIAKKSGGLKALLLNQTFLAGVGNIYADETLWRAKLHPFFRAADLEDSQVAALHKAIRASLKEGIKHNGAAIDWVYPEGNYQNFFRVYGRTGQPCRRCRTPIEHTLVGQRSTHFCPCCQLL